MSIVAEDIYRYCGRLGCCSTYRARLVEHQLHRISLLTQVGTRSSFGLQNGGELFMSDAKTISFSS